MNYAQARMVAKIVLWFIEALVEVTPRLAESMRAMFGAFKDGDVGKGLEHLEALAEWADDAIDNVSGLIFVSVPQDATLDQLEKLDEENKLMRFKEAAEQLKVRGGALGADVGTTEARKQVQIRFDTRAKLGTLPEGAPLQVPVTT